MNRQANSLDSWATQACTPNALLESIAFENRRPGAALLKAARAAGTGNGFSGAESAGGPLSYKPQRLCVFIALAALGPLVWTATALAQNPCRVQGPYACPTCGTCECICEDCVAATTPTGILLGEYFSGGCESTEPVDVCLGEIVIARFQAGDEDDCILDPSFAILTSDVIDWVEFTIIPAENVRVIECDYDFVLETYFVIFEVLKEGPFTLFVEADDRACAGAGANDPPVTCFIDYEAAKCFTDKDLKLGSDQICPNAKTTATLTHCICGLDPEPALSWTYEVASGEPGVKVEIRDTGAGICEREIIAGDKTGEVWIIAKYEDCEARQLLKIGCSGCDSGSCSAGSGNANLGSVDARFNLGTGPGGDSAGHLGIFAEQPSAALATPRVLRSNISSDLTFEYRDPATDALLQVLAPQVFVDVVYTLPDDEDYQLYFYSLDQLLAYGSTGPWSLKSEPQAFLYWHIENPSAPGVYDGIKLSRYVDDGQQGWTLKQVYEYSYAPYTDPQGRQAWIWTLTTGDGGTPERTETDEWVWDTVAVPICPNGRGGRETPMSPRSYRPKRVNRGRPGAIRKSVPSGYM